MNIALHPQSDVKWQGSSILLKQGKTYPLFGNPGSYQTFDEHGRRVPVNLTISAGMTILNRHIYNPNGMYEDVVIDVVTG